MHRRRVRCSRQPFLTGRVQCLHPTLGDRGEEKTSSEGHEERQVEERGTLHEHQHLLPAMTARRQQNEANPVVARGTVIQRQRLPHALAGFVLVRMAQGKQ